MRRIPPQQPQAFGDVRNRPDKMERAARIQSMRPCLHPFDDAGFLFELEQDGFRVVC